MKLRISAQSLRLRLSRSDVARFIDVGKIEEAIYFAPEEDASLSYTLMRVPSGDPLRIKYREREILVIVATDIAKAWADEGVQIQGRVETSRGELELLIEKDFACLHGDSRDKHDTFPNPLEINPPSTESLGIPSRQSIQFAEGIKEHGVAIGVHERK